MSAKAKARFAAGFILAILLTVIAVAVSSLYSGKLIASEYNIVTVPNPACSTSGGGGGSECAATIQQCVASDSGTYCTLAECQAAITP